MKNPGVSVVLGFLIPGLGHIYCGEIGAGLVLLAAYLLSIFLYLELVLPSLALVSIFIWIFSIYSSYRTAARFNTYQKTKQAKQHKKCPYCAELIMAEASICRYCNHNIGPQPDSILAPAPENTGTQ